MGRSTLAGFVWKMLCLFYSTLPVTAARAVSRAVAAAAKPTTTIGLAIHLAVTHATVPVPGQVELPRRVDHAESAVVLAVAVKAAPADAESPAAAVT